MKKLTSAENKLINEAIAFAMQHHGDENFHHELETRFNVLSMDTGGGIELTPIRVNDDTLIGISSDSIYLYSVENGKGMSDEELFNDEKAIENAVQLADFSQQVNIDMKRDDGKIKFSGSYNGIKFSREFEMEGDTMNGKFNKIESEFEAESDQEIDSSSLMIIRAKLLDELKKMGFDFEGNPPKFSAGGTPWVVMQPMKAFAKGGTIEEETDLLTEVIADTVAERAVGDHMKNELADWKNLDEHGRKELDKKYVSELKRVSDYLVERAETTFNHNADFKKNVKASGNKGRDYLYLFMYHWAGYYGDKVVQPYSKNIENWEKAKRNAKKKMEKGGTIKEQYEEVEKKLMQFTKTNVEFKDLQSSADKFFREKEALIKKRLAMIGKGIFNTDAIDKEIAEAKSKMSKAYDRATVLLSKETEKIKSSMPISKEAKDVLRDEWNKMQEFLSGPALEMKRGGVTEELSEEQVELYGTVDKDQWDEYNKLKSKIEFAPYGIPSEVAVFVGKEQSSKKFHQMYGTIDHIKKAFEYIENRSHLADIITKAGDAEEYPALVKKQKFQVVALNENSYNEGYRAYAFGGIVESLRTFLNKKVTLEDFKK